MTDKPTTPEYFAVPDPLDPDKLCYWYRHKRGRHAGQLSPWPPRRNRWGRLTWAEVNAQPERDREDYQVAHWAKVRAARQQIQQAIADDPDLAAARWSLAHSSCCFCGKALTDQRSKAYGIGPDCRAGAPPEVLAELIRRMEQAHAEGRLSWRENDLDDPELFAAAREE
jgi:hypothetical protein